MIEKIAEMTMQIYLHPLNGSHGAPSGCIGVSHKPHHDDVGAIDGPAALISIDPYGLALSDDEAEEMAAELCRRWNSFSPMQAVTKAAVLYCTTGQDRGGEKLLDAVAAYREMKK